MSAGVVVVIVVVIIVVVVLVLISPTLEYPRAAAKGAIVMALGHPLDDTMHVKGMIALSPYWKVTREGEQERKKHR